MKINLLKNFDPANCITGYITISPNATQNTDDCKMGDFVNLDEYCDDGEVEEIFADDVVDYMNPSAINSIFDNWVRKLSHKGIVVIGGIETYSICKAANLRVIDITNLNLLLRGCVDNPFLAKKFTYNIEDIIQLLKSKGLKIIKASVHDMRYTVVGERP